MTPRKTDATEPADVLVVNAGSSSLKTKLVPNGAWATVERIGGDALVRTPSGATPLPDARDHADALRACVDALLAQTSLGSLAAVGHRVVHGGERYTEPLLLDDAALDALEALSPLAPLHNPPNLTGIRAAKAILPDLPHVAVFDTAFHGTLPAEAHLYGLPYELAEREGIRKYGFHGTSHAYVARRAAELLERDLASLRIVTLHLGNGASAAAVHGGRSVDTSMGFTPLDGLLMGTRSGSIDPGVLLRLLRNGLGVDELDDLLNRRSGLLGLSGVSNDMRDVRAAADAGDERARVALRVYAYRARTTVGAYAAAMGGIDALVFTAGVGENDPRIRAEITSGLEFLGLELDPVRNDAGGPLVSREGSLRPVLVVPTDEEAEIARHAATFARPGRRTMVDS